MIRRWCAQLALMSFVTLLCLLALEAALRLYSGIPLFSTENFVAAALDVVRQPGGVSRYDSKFGWAQEANTAFNPMDPLQPANWAYACRAPPRVHWHKTRCWRPADSLTVGSEVSGFLNPGRRNSRR